MAYSFDLSGRVALVTGASSGLGARFARRLAESGARVAIAARRAELLEGLAAEIAAAGGTAFPVAMDVANEASVIAGYDAIEAAIGPVDTIVANAGTSIETPVVDTKIEELERLLAVNFTGVFLTLREGARRLIAANARERQHGRMVIIGSITADIVAPGLAAYSGTKAGVRQMGKVLARDWMRQGINVNTISPGYILTEINDEWFRTEAGQKQIQRFPRRRLMPEDGLDAMLLYLCSDASAAVTGVNFTLDDGQSL